MGFPCTAITKWLLCSKKHASFIRSFHFCLFGNLSSNDLQLHKVGIRICTKQGQCYLPYRKVSVATASRTLPGTRTLTGKETQFELAGNSSYRGKFQWNFDQGKANLDPISGEFELSEFKSYRSSTVLLTPVRAINKTIETGVGSMIA